MVFFSASILLSGFVFPFAGMPAWAQYVGEGLPLTHYLRIVRAIMLKGATMQNLRFDALALAALMLVAMTIAAPPFPRAPDSARTNPPHFLFPLSPAPTPFFPQHTQR